MKAVSILFVALFALAFAKPGKVTVVDQPSKDAPVFQNVDSFFQQPGGPSNGEFQQPDISPTFVNQGPNYPVKYDDPRLRGGK